MPQQQRPQQFASVNATALADRSVELMDSLPPPASASESEPAGMVQTASGHQTLVQRHQEIEHLNQRMLDVVYGGNKVTDCILLDHMVRHNLNFESFSSWLELGDKELENYLCSAETRLASRLVKNLPHTRLVPLVHLPAIAELVVHHRPRLFHYLPTWIKTEQELTPLLNKLPLWKRPRLLSYIAQRDPQLAAHFENMEQAIKRNASWACCYRADELTFALRCLAIQTDYKTLPQFENTDAEQYSALCDLALQQSGKALEHMHRSSITPVHVDQALRHSQPPGIEAIPPRLHTRERLLAALPHTACGLSSAFLDQWDLWEPLKKQPEWLHCLLSKERTPALCNEYISRFPTAPTPIPWPILRENPQWQHGREQPDVYLPLAEHILEGSSCEPGYPGGLAFCDASSALTDEQLWALFLKPLDQQLEDLPHGCREAIVAQGGAAGLASMLKAPAFCLAPEALLDPVQEEHCSRRAAFLPQQARLQLMATRGLRLPRQGEGFELRERMDHHFQDLLQQLTHGSLRHWAPLPGSSAWGLRGGRTLASTANGVCVHMKLHRQGESLRTFTAEQAAQDFARAHPKCKWHSEIPNPEGMFLVALDDLPVREQDFPDAPAVYNYGGKAHALAFCFTTKDDSYDTLAWQPDVRNGCERSQQGLLRALHDLGVWSSLGAVHTSTTCLYHQFLDDGESRPELLLAAFFKPGDGYPGKLHHWNTRATQHSDWGLSGLRDLGDLELYPFITTYLESGEAEVTLPDYGQKASFVNAIAQNILASLLHYMRQHRATDPDYHYQEPEAVTALAQFIEQGCDAFVYGLLGKGTRLMDLFTAAGAGLAEAYPAWLQLTAREIIYWSALQQEEGECFSQHLNQTGRPSTELYPGHPWQEIRYGDHYTEAEGENLGAHNKKFPLFYLVRGLYVLAIGVARRLEEQDPPEPGQQPLCGHKRGTTCEGEDHSGLVSRSKIKVSS